MGHARSCARTESSSSPPRPAGRRAGSRRTASSIVPVQSRGHSAHVGQEVEVFYRWHALYGRRLRRQYGEQRATGDVVHVEVAPGIVLVVAAWMLDAAACTGMELGAPRASMAALVNLHELLSRHGLRRSSSGVLHTDYEEQDDPSIQTAFDAASASHADGATPIEHCVRIPCASGDESLSTSQRSHTVGHSAAAGCRNADAGGTR